MLAKSKLDSIDLEISHEEFKTILNEKEKYEKMKGNFGMVKSSDELIENKKNIRKIMEMCKIKFFF